MSKRQFSSAGGKQKLSLPYKINSKSINNRQHQKHHQDLISRWKTDNWNWVELIVFTRSPQSTEKNIDWELTCQKTFASKCHSSLVALKSYSFMFVPIQKKIYNHDQCLWKIVWCSGNWYDFWSHICQNPSFAIYYLRKLEQDI